MNNLISADKLVSAVVAQHRRRETCCEHDLDGRTVAVPSGVFDPFLAPSGPIMLELASYPGAFAGKRVLDMGCGSGIGTALIESVGGAALVVGVDISDESIAASRVVADAFGCTRTRILHGDLFAPLDAGSTFDVIVANLPFAEGAVSDVLDMSFFDPNHRTMSRFLQKAPDHLAADGSLLLLTSDMVLGQNQVNSGRLRDATHIGIPIGDFTISVHELRSHSYTPSFSSLLNAIAHSVRMAARIQKILSSAVSYESTSEVQSTRPLWA